MEKFENIIEMVIENNSLEKIIMSSILKKEMSYKKIEIKPFKKNDSLFYQITFVEEKKSIHKNFEENEIYNEIIKLSEDFKQINIFSKGADYQVLKNNKGSFKIIENKKEEHIGCEIKEHNRKKEYIIEENKPCDFLKELGVMDETVKVYAKKYDKYRQINRYLEFVRDSLKDYPEKNIKIVDFGSGKAYLTFALYYYVVKILKIEAEIYGVDLKEDVIKFCNNTAEKINYKGLKFVYGDIKSFDILNKADFVITLHACDTATDDAIIQSLKWDAKIIMCVPCCQHEFFSKIKSEVMNPVIKYGIHKERIATILTDSVRGLILEIMGYDVKIMEFIDMEHTPKNILIKAVKGRKSKTEIEKLKKEYEDLKNFWGIETYIEQLCDIGKA